VEEGARATHDERSTDDLHIETRGRAASIYNFPHAARVGDGHDWKIYRRGEIAPFVAEMLKGSTVAVGVVNIPKHLRSAYLIYEFSHPFYPR
jgi:hypothetical protein